MATQTKRKTYAEEYAELRRKKEKYIKSLQRKGYAIDTNVLPKVPKRIRAESIRKLQSYTPKTIKVKAGIEKPKPKAATKRKKKIKPVEVTSLPTPTPTDFPDVVETPDIAPPEPEVPTFDIIEYLHSMINSLPSERYYGYKRRIDLEPFKQRLHSIINDNDAENHEKYAAYLMDNESEIVQSLNIIMYASKQKEVQEAQGDLLFLINYGAAPSESVFFDFNGTFYD